MHAHVSIVGLVRNFMFDNERLFLCWRKYRRLLDAIRVIMSLIPLHSSTSLILPTSILIPIVLICLYRIFVHPLASVPGPLVAKCTSLWQILHSYLGDECTAVQALHRRYGKVVRIGPNMVDISDGAALGPIYVERGGFPKPSSYHNAYTDGFATIFSTTDSAYRATRAKVVAPLFSTAAIRRDSRTLYESVERFLQALQKSKEMAKGRPVDLQMHTRALGLDVLASYLFRHRPSSSQEQIDQGSMIPWLNVIVDVGQFFYLPSQLFRFCVTLYIRFRPRRYTEAISTKFVHEYTMSLPRDDGNKDGTFQGRLLEQGISRENVAAECKSMMFAGIHSSGSVLAMTLWYLAKDPIM